MTTSLKGIGQGVVLGVPDNSVTPRDYRGTPRDLSGFSNQDMESTLFAKFGKRPNLSARDSAEKGGHSPVHSCSQTARGLLEENRMLIAEKQERKAMARQNSKEEFERLIAQDLKSSEGDKARDLHKLATQRELARHYKEKIGVSHRTKVEAYRDKQERSSETYFPFVEGENITSDRRAKRSVMQEEMRGFLNQQRQEKPPRADKLLVDVKGEQVDYPLDPVPGRVKGTASILPRPQSRPSSAGPRQHGGGAGEEVPPHMARHPRFLSRASEHMSRRLQDSHVRKALEDKVLQTKAELEAAQSKREVEQQQWREGMNVNDALRYDRDQARATERHRNAEVLKHQITERSHQAAKDKQAGRKEAAGYWGPEEKPPQDPEVHRSHCSDLIKQMEVDQVRRQIDKTNRHRQEKQLIDNCMAEMTQDRRKDVVKQLQHREVLTTTWTSQQKIKKALDTLEAI